MNKKAKEAMKKLIGIQCKECKKYFADSKFLIGHEMSVHNLFPSSLGISGNPMLTTASYVSQYSGSGYQTNLSTNPGYQGSQNPFPNNPLPVKQKEDDGFGFN